MLTDYNKNLNLFGFWKDFPEDVMNVLWWCYRRIKQTFWITIVNACMFQSFLCTVELTSNCGFEGTRKTIVRHGLGSSIHDDQVFILPAPSVDKWCWWWQWDWWCDEDVGMDVDAGYEVVVNSLWQVIYSILFIPCNASATERGQPWV
jgi:hypothetical protein